MFTNHSNWKLQWALQYHFDTEETEKGNADTNQSKVNIKTSNDKRDSTYL